MGLRWINPLSTSARPFQARSQLWGCPTLLAVFARGWVATQARPHGTRAFPVTGWAVLGGDVNSVRIPTGVKVINLGDVTLLPGFIDAHTHLIGRVLGDPDGDTAVVRDYQSFGAILGVYLLLSYAILPYAWGRFMARHPALKEMPKTSFTKDGIPGDPLPAGLSGTPPC